MHSAAGGLTGQSRVMDPLELETQAVVCELPDVGVGNQSLLQEQQALLATGLPFHPSYHHFGRSSMDLVVPYDGDLPISNPPYGDYVILLLPAATPHDQHHLLFKNQSVQLIQKL